jgi:predicted RNase H-like nuclease (RuvC/YqgF family)
VKDEITKVIEVNVRENSDLHHKVETMSNEIIEMKNERRALSNLKQKVHWASDASSKVEALVEETNNLYSFFQKFIDENAVDRINMLRSPDINLKEKMNTMDWLARNCDYLTA